MSTWQVSILVNDEVYATRTVRGDEIEPDVYETLDFIRKNGVEVGYVLKCVRLT